MSKYKVGDKVLLKATIVDRCIDSKHPIKVKFADESIEWFEEEYLMPDMTSVETIPQEEIMQSAYNQGLADAWELAKKLYLGKYGYSKALEDSEIKKIYATRDLTEIMESSPKEALAKLKAYEEAQEIKVGDIIRFKESSNPAELYVTQIGRENWIYAFDITNGHYYSNPSNCYVKTGKNVPLERILEQIGGE